MTTPSAQPRTPWGVAVVFGIIGSLLVGLIVLAFMWPGKTAEPRDLPVSITGPPASVAAIEANLDKASPGTLDLIGAADREDAITQIKTRETYGAIVLADPPGMPEVLTAPAASASATQLLTGVATQLQAQLEQQVSAAGGDASDVQVKVTAVVPLSDADPAGSGLAAVSLPLTIGGILGGLLVSFLVVGTARSLVALGGFAVATGLLLAVILQTWFEYMTGDFWLSALAIGASILATATFVVGCAAVLGRVGISLAALFTLLFANPISAAAVPWQFLAAPWGAVGQWLVPGAANWLVRSVAYFPDANVARQWWILLGWIALGVALMLVGHFRDTVKASVPEGAPAN